MGLKEGVAPFLRGVADGQHWADGNFSERKEGDDGVAVFLHSKGNLHPLLESLRNTRGEISGEHVNVESGRIPQKGSGEMA